MSNKKLIKRKVLTLILLSSCNFYLLNSATSAKAMFLNNLFNKISSKVSKKEETPKENKDAKVQKAPAVWKAAEVRKSPEIKKVPEVRKVLEVRKAPEIKKVSAILEAEMKKNSRELIQCIKNQGQIEELKPLLQKPVLFDETHTYVNGVNILGYFIYCYNSSFKKNAWQEYLKKLELILDWSHTNTPQAINNIIFKNRTEDSPAPFIGAMHHIKDKSRLLEACRRLLEDQNIDVNIKWKGKTALDWALELRHQEIESLLRSKGAMRSNPNAKKVENVCTFKAVPCKQKIFSALKEDYKLSEAEIEMKQNSDKLIECIKNQKSIEELKSLLQKPLLFDETHTYVNGVNILGYFIFYHEESFNNDKWQESLEKLKLILDWSHTNTPQAINKLIHNDGEENLPTPLIGAIRYIKNKSVLLNVCQMLLEEKNINVNIECNGKTALNWALELRYPEIERLLRNKGAREGNPNTKRAENVCTFKAVPCKQKAFVTSKECYKANDLNDPQVKLAVAVKNRDKSKIISLRSLLNGIVKEGDPSLCFTPLCIAVNNKDKDMIDYLLSNGAQLNVQSLEDVAPEKKFPLYTAISNRDKDMVEFLVNEKHAKFRKLKSGQSSLNIALANAPKNDEWTEKDVEFIKFIWDLDREKCGNDSSRPEWKSFMNYLIRKKENELFKCLYYMESNENLSSYLSTASTIRNSEMLGYLKSQSYRNADSSNPSKAPAKTPAVTPAATSAKTSNGNSKEHSPLCCACFDVKLDQVKNLVSRGAKVNDRDEKGYTPLEAACFRDNLEIVKYLVSQGAKVNDRSENGWTPLLSACRHGNLGIAEYLVSQGAKVNDRDNNGWTPLHVACDSGNSEIAEYLISKGADIDEENDKEYTPLDIACLSHSLKTVQILLKEGACPNGSGGKRKPLTTTLLDDNKENLADIVNLLLRYGAIPNVRYKGKEPTVFLCFGYNSSYKMDGKRGDQRIEALEHLIEYGLDVNAKNSEGKTILKYISGRRNLSDAAEGFKGIVENAGGRLY